MVVVLWFIVAICLMYVAGKFIELAENLWKAFEPVRKLKRGT